MESYAGGNRANLLFVETCLDHIQETPANSDTAIYESAILGLQSGHFQSVNRICNIKFKDDLWSHFKSASTQLRLVDQCQSECVDDHYNSFYSMLMTPGECYKLQERLGKISSPLVGKHRNDYGAFFQENFTKYTDLSWFERVQLRIIEITLKSSQYPGENLWDTLLRDFLETSGAELRFSAHFAMLLMLQNRVTNAHLYNTLVSKYI